LNGFHFSHSSLPQGRQRDPPWPPLAKGVRRQVHDAVCRIAGERSAFRAGEFRLSFRCASPRAAAFHPPSDVVHCPLGNPGRGPPKGWSTGTAQCSAIAGYW
jgi:hypothetical protein